MKLTLIQNSKLLAKNKIRHDGDFSIVESYLATTPGYTPIDDVTLDITGKVLTQLKFNVTFIDGNNNFEASKVNEYDSCIVFDYPYLPGIKSFWIITNKKLDSSKNWTFTLDLDLVTTFGTSKLNLDNKIGISRKHINYLKQFNSYADKTVNKNSILKQQQPSNNFEIRSYEYTNIFYNELEEEFKDKLGIVFWALHQYPGDYGLIRDQTVFSGKVIQDDGTVDYTDTVGVTNPDAELLTPFINSNIRFNNLGAVEDILEYNPVANFRDTILSSASNEKTRIIDFLPVNSIEIKETTDGELAIFSKENPDQGTSGIYYNALQAVQDDGQQGIPDKIVGFNFTGGWVKEFITQEYKIKSNDLFDFKYPDTIFFDNDSLNAWESNQILEIEFAPFKEFEIGYQSEKPFSSITITNSDLDKLPIAHSVFFERIFTFSVTANTHYNNYKYQSNGNNINKVSRSLEAPLNNDAWNNVNIAQRERILQQYGLPIVGTIGSALIGGPIGAGVSFGIAMKAGGTSLNNQKIKATPDTTTNAATDFRDIALTSELNSKRLFIHRPDDRTQESIAFEFHKWGTFHFFIYDKYTVEELLPKYRFNYLELSPNTTIENTKELDQIFALRYLSQLQNGISFWEWDTNNEYVTKYIFDYNYKNPDKEGIMEQINFFRYLSPEIGHTYTFTIDNSSGKYDKGLIIETGLGGSDTSTATLPEHDNVIIAESSMHISTTLKIDSALVEKATIKRENDTQNIIIEYQNILVSRSISIIGTFNPDDISVVASPATKKTIKALEKQIKQHEAREAKLKKNDNQTKRLTPEQREALNTRLDKIAKQEKNKIMKDVENVDNRES